MRALEKTREREQATLEHEQVIPGSRSELLGSTSELLGSTSELLGSIAINVTCSSFLHTCICKVYIERYCINSVLFWLIITCMCTVFTQHIVFRWQSINISSYVQSIVYCIHSILY